MSAQRTPHLTLGPFYPVSAPTAAAGLLWSAGQFERVVPLQRVEISGRVINLAGVPVVHARVEVWQADDLGRYRHPSSPAPAPEDPGFVGYGAVCTDASGGFRFRTLKPGAYLEGGQRRAPHLHFQVTGTHDRLVTQMFFPDALNLDDRWYLAASRPEQLVAACLKSTAQELLLSWDIVLPSG